LLKKERKCIVFIGIWAKKDITKRLSDDRCKLGSAAFVIWLYFIYEQYWLGISP